MSNEPQHSTPAPQPKGLVARYKALRQNKAISLGIDLLIGLTIFSAITAFQTRDLLQDRQPAPPFSLTTMQGQRIDHESLKGKKTLLLFWAPWCTVCHAESHNIKAIKAAYKDEINLVSIALAYEDRADVQAFIDKHQVDYPVLLGHNQTQRSYQISAFPTLYILDEQGRVEDALVGYTTELGIRLRLWF